LTSRRRNRGALGIPPVCAPRWPFPSPRLGSLWPRDVAGPAMEIGAILGLNDLKAKGAADARLPLAAIQRSGCGRPRLCSTSPYYDCRAPSTWAREPARGRLNDAAN
jgi:hypothetical protein